MEDELRSWINMTHGPNAWNDLLKMQTKIRKQRQETLYAQAELREKILTTTGIIIGAIVFTGAIVGILYLVTQRSPQ